MAQQDLYGRIPPGWHPPQALPSPQQGQVPNYGFDPMTIEGRLPPQGVQQPGQGPTYGDERKRLAEESMKVDRAPAKIRETQETKSDGQKIKTISNDEAKVVKKIGPDGKVSSVKITTNDTVNDPIDGSPLALAEAPPEEPQAQSLRARLNNAPQGAAQFQAPPRTWANMDWTPLRKLTDDVYGTNIAEGSVDPYIAEYSRALQEFKLNNPGAGKGGKDSTLAWARFEHTKKTDRDEFQYKKELKIENDLEKEKGLKENLRRYNEEFARKQADSESLRAYRNSGGKGKNLTPHQIWKQKDERDKSIERKQRAADKKTLRENPPPKPLGGEERKRHDNIEQALSAIMGMDKALAEGGNTFELIGDDDFTMHRGRWEEAYGRMQSMGAIRPDEEVRFANSMPTWRDSKKIQVKKLRDMRQMILERRQAFKGRADQPDRGELQYGAGSAKIEARLKELRQNKVERRKKKAARDKRRKEILGGGK